jgi:tellurite resistance protein
MMVLTSQLLASLPDAQIDALIEVMTLAASCDGELSPAELGQLKKSLTEVDELWLSHADVEGRVAAAQQRIAQASRAVRLRMLKSALPKGPVRQAALELALHVVAADGIIRTSERDLILETAEILEIDRDTAADLVRSIAG